MRLIVKGFKKEEEVCLYFVVVDGDAYVGPDIMNLLGVAVFDQFRGNGGWGAALRILFRMFF